MKKRCEWAKGELLEKYHDEEYGNISHDDAYIFEVLVMEFMQAGLSFEIILKKREAMRKAFDGFDYRKIAGYDDRKIEELMANDKIIRNKKKLKALVKNAKAFIKVREDYGSFDRYLENFIKEPIDYKRKEGEVIAKSKLSEKLSKDMKDKSFSFVGPVTIHSFLEAIGRINCHCISCFKHKNS